jgi:hypothetical protein
MSLQMSTRVLQQDNKKVIYLPVFNVRSHVCLEFVIEGSKYVSKLTKLSVAFFLKAVLGSSYLFSLYSQ